MTAPSGRLVLGDGRLLTWSAGRRTARLWSVEGAELAALRGHQRVVYEGALELSGTGGC